MKLRSSRFIFFALFLMTSIASAGSIEKARALRQNGLLTEAKKELVEVVFADESTSDIKAEALVLLGDIAVDEKKYDAARDDWTKAITAYPTSPASTPAKEKLKLLDQLSRTPQSAATLEASPMDYPPGTVLVVGPEKYDWASVQISGALGNGAVSIKGSFREAYKVASQQKNVVAIVDVTLDTEAVFETGRVTCYAPNGKKTWQEKVFVNWGGSPEHIARRFVDKLAVKVKDRKCP